MFTEYYSRNVKKIHFHFESLDYIYIYIYTGENVYNFVAVTKVATPCGANHLVKVNNHVNKLDRSRNIEL